MRRLSGPDTPELIAKKLTEGRGRGTGSTYAPWIKVGEIRSNGEQRILRGHKTGRLHHYFSRGESNHHLFAEFSKKVVDIREQFPMLPIDYSLEVARKLGIRHPQFAGTPTVVTFDFLLTISDGNAHRHLVRSVKRSDDLKKQRVLEKLTLERQLCLEQGFRYEIVTELQMGAIPLSNLKFLWQWTRLKRPDPDPIQKQTFLQVLYQQDFQNPLGHVLGKVAAELCIAPSLAIWLFQKMAWEKNLAFNIEEPLHLTKPHLGLARNPQNAG